MASSAALTTTHLPRLRTILEEWRRMQPTSTGFAAHVPKTQEFVVEAKDITVAFRTRPPLPNEAAEKFKSEDAEGHVENTEEGKARCKVSGPNDEPTLKFCAGISVMSAEPGIFVAHVPGMKWNGPTLSHKKYEADLAFGPDVDNEEVYRKIVVDNDIISLVLSGGIGCVLAYGQTGSGKTFTMEGLEHRIARDLFEAARVVGTRLLMTEQGTTKDTGETGRNDDVRDVFEFSVTFLELLGKHASDLVDSSIEVNVDGHPVKSVSILEDKLGDVRPKLVSTQVHSSAELEELINSALAHRRTTATLRNATSSRSHALLTIRVKNRLLPYAEGGQLILVDLAGSERHEDSKAHDKQRMEETKENNKTLMNLKECVRAKAKMAEEDGFVHVPWRSSKLTMLLKPIFDIESRQPSKIVIIAHVSPHIQDTTHSANTLSYASPFKASLPKQRSPAPFDASDPRTWNHLRTHAWVTNEFTNRANFDRMGNREAAVDVDKLCPPGLTANYLAKMYTMEFVEKCLQARILNVDIDVVKSTAVDVIGRLFYLVITAKNRTRNEIMKSRKPVADDVYGEAPTQPRRGRYWGAQSDKS